MSSYDSHPMEPLASTSRSTLGPQGGNDYPNSSGAGHPAGDSTVSLSMPSGVREDEAPLLMDGASAGIGGKGKSPGTGIAGKGWKTHRASGSLSAMTRSQLRGRRNSNSSNDGLEDEDDWDYWDDGGSGDYERRSSSGNRRSFAGIALGGSSKRPGGSSKSSRRGAGTGGAPDFINSMRSWAGINPSNKHERSCWHRVYETLDRRWKLFFGLFLVIILLAPFFMPPSFGTRKPPQQDKPEQSSSDDAKGPGIGDGGKVEAGAGAIDKPPPEKKPPVNNINENEEADTFDYTASLTWTSSHPAPIASLVSTPVDIYLPDGSSMTYSNPFGGVILSLPSSPDPKSISSPSFDLTQIPYHPSHDTAYPNSHTPPLNKEWDFSNDLIRGVNLGGWLVMEPLITPEFYEMFEDGNGPGGKRAIDEWTLAERLREMGGRKKLRDMLERHFDTFITERDFALIAASGLNWVRIPVPYWIIEVWDGVDQEKPKVPGGMNGVKEPFLEGIGWKYFLRGIEWARKYGLRVQLDLHSVPGSQNGWNHSGKEGSINFLMGVMGIANAQRSLNYIRALSEFISRPEYKNVVPMFGMVNEILVKIVGDKVVRTFYLECYQMIRELFGVGAGNGPFLIIHDGFRGGQKNWRFFLKGADRISLESHNYLSFGKAPNNDSLFEQSLKPCHKWPTTFNNSMADFGFSFSGEWSLAINDCGRYVNGLDEGPGYEGAKEPEFPAIGSCKEWTDYWEWNEERKNGLQDVARAIMDVTRNWFFWTWKTANSSKTGTTVNPFWSYSLGVQEGYIPNDPRTGLGYCDAAYKVAGVPAPASTAPSHYKGTLEPWKVGGPGADKISQKQLKEYAFPPASLADINDTRTLPTYTPTGKPIVLRGKGMPKETAVVGKGKRTGWYVPIEGCDLYLDPWDGNGKPAPTRTCK